jgi:hypothetical protein
LFSGGAYFCKAEMEGNIMRYWMSVMLLVVCTSAYGHPGRTNSEGCHYNRRTGDYHCHNSGSKPTKKVTGSTKSKPVKTEFPEGNIVYMNDVSPVPLKARHTLATIDLEKLEEWLSKSDLARREIHFSQGSIIDGQHDINVWSFKRTGIVVKQLDLVRDITEDFLQADNAEATFSGIRMKKENGVLLFCKEDLINKKIIDK